MSIPAFRAVEIQSLPGTAYVMEPLGQWIFIFESFMSKEEAQYQWIVRMHRQVYLEELFCAGSDDVPLEVILLAPYLVLIDLARVFSIGHCQKFRVDNFQRLGRKFCFY